MKDKGTIVITLDNASFAETERCRKIIHALFEEGFFSVKSGSFTANFDELGNYASSERRIVRKANRPLLDTNSLLESFKIETTRDDSDVAIRS